MANSRSSHFKPVMHSYPGNVAKTYELDPKGLADVKFGKEIKEKEFLLKPGISFLNHGSYGTVPKRVLALQSEYNLEREEHPDLWFRINAKNYLDKACKAVADFIGADAENVLLVHNVTSALNVVIRSYPFEGDSAILEATLTYGSISNLCEDFTSRLRPDVKRLTLEIGFPIKSEEDVIRKYEEMFNQHSNIKMVIIDHITSPTSMVMPVKKLVDLAQKHGALAVVDGAHTIGQLPLNMKELGADIYTTNLHKWGYSPRGAAVLYYNNKHSEWLQPANTSWQIGLSLDQQFFDQGTRDHIPLICARHGLQFYQALGGMDKIVKYTKDLADKAKDMMTKELGLEPLPIPETMEAPNLRLVKLPPLSKYPFDEKITWDLQRAIFGDTSVFGILTPVDGDFYFRFSTQVYNDMEDFTAATGVLKDFIAKNS